MDGSEAAATAAAAATADVTAADDDTEPLFDETGDGVVGG